MLYKMQLILTINPFRLDAGAKNTDIYATPGIFRSTLLLLRLVMKRMSQRKWKTKEEHKSNNIQDWFIAKLWRMMNDISEGTHRIECHLKSTPYKIVKSVCRDLRKTGEILNFLWRLGRYRRSIWAGGENMSLLRSWFIEEWFACTRNVYRLSVYTCLNLSLHPCSSGYQNEVWGTVTQVEFPSYPCPSKIWWWSPLGITLGLGLCSFFSFLYQLLKWRPSCLIYLYLILWFSSFISGCTPLAEVSVVQKTSSAGLTTYRSR